MEQKKRNINFEILRILCMYIIVSNHAINVTVLGEGKSVYGIEWIHLYRAAGGFMVDVFVLITGYFMINSKINIKKLILIWFQVIVLLGGVYAWYCFSGEGIMTLDGWQNCFFPISRRVYWFISVYFALYVCVPFINKIIAHISKKQYMTMLIILTFGITIIPTLSHIDTFGIAGGYGICLFIYLYFIAGYIKIYDVQVRKRTAMAWYLASTAVLWISIIYAMHKYPDNINRQYVLYKNDGFFVVIQSVAILLFFRELGSKKISSGIQKLVIKMSGTTLGIFIIHTHPWNKTYLWNNKFGLSQESSFGEILWAAALVMIIAGAIDFARNEIFIGTGRIIDLIDRNELLKRWQNGINRLLNGE